MMTLRRIVCLLFNQQLTHRDTDNCPLC